MNKARHEELAQALKSACRRYETLNRNYDEKEVELEALTKERDRLRDNPRTMEEAGKAPILDGQVRFLEKALDKIRDHLNNIDREDIQLASEIAEYIAMEFGAGLKAAAAKWAKIIEKLEPDPIRAAQLIASTAAAQNLTARATLPRHCMQAGGHSIVQAFQLMIPLMEEIAARHANGSFVDVI